jgi:arginase family enzyme
MSNVSVVGVPFCGGQPRGGVENAPKDVRDAGLEPLLTKVGWNVSTK